MKTKQEQAEARVEKAVGELFGALYALEHSPAPQAAYDSMGTIGNLLSEYRAEIRKKGVVQI